MTHGIPLRVAVDLTGKHPGSARLFQAAELFVPDRAHPGTPPVVLFCLPGGHCTGDYFDIDVQGDPSFSFARALAVRGFFVVTLDHLGIGRSSRPDDLFLLTPDIIAAANSQAVAAITADLRAGTAAPSLAALPDLVSVGIGHSMGAMLTMFQQAQYGQHRAVVLLGFGTRGLPEFLTEEEARYADDPAALRADIVTLARARFGRRHVDTEESVAVRERWMHVRPEARASKAFTAVLDRLLPSAGLFPMIPGSVIAEARQIDVPVFVGVGDTDMAGLPHAIPASFTGSADVTLVVLPDTAHNHFLFGSRILLYDRLAGWLAGQFAA